MPSTPSTTATTSPHKHRSSPTSRSTNNPTRPLSPSGPPLDPKIREIWDSLDTGKVGKVSVATIIAHADQLQRQIPELLNRLEYIAQNGEVSYKDYKAFFTKDVVKSPEDGGGSSGCSSPRFAISDAELKSLFDSLDTSQSGSLSVGELLAHKDLIQAKFPDLLTKFETIDADHSTTISWEELRYYLHSDSEDAWLDYQLSNVVGLDKLKEQLRRFSRAMVLDQKRRNKGHNVSSSGKYHMIFQGNPGTGKTSLARIMAKLLQKVGITKTDKLVEVQRADLIAEYVGQSAPKTQKKIEEALEGILFIDEAYRLSQNGSKNDFGREAIEQLMGAMNEPPGKAPVMIFAGYQDAMEDFMRANDGLYRRIAYTFDFTDYTPLDLAEIFEVFSYKKGYSIEETLLRNRRKRLAEIIESNTLPRSRSLMNGGMCERIFDQAKQCLDQRDDPDNPTVILNEIDITTACKLLPPPPAPSTTTSKDGNGNSTSTNTDSDLQRKLLLVEKENVELQARIALLTHELDKARGTTNPSIQVPSVSVLNNSTAPAPGIIPPPQGKYEIRPCLQYTGGCLLYYTGVAASAAWSCTRSGATWGYTRGREAAVYAQHQYQAHQSANPSSSSKTPAEQHRAPDNTNKNDHP